MLNEFHRLHVTVAGDPALAAAWLPFGKARVRELMHAQRAFGGNRDQTQQYAPAAGVSVRARVVGEDKFLYIRATSGCDDRQGFLLSRRGSMSYTAMYNDGFVERIDPIAGTPRTNPDAATRTKGYAVPVQLQYEQLSRVSASKFSGLMRLAVGCYHAAGKNAPFRHGHAITHGIVKKTAVVNNQTVTRYWVVEITPQGVFAAPVGVGSKCCESWNISAYKAHAVEFLSLRSRYASGDRDAIKELVSAVDMAPVYADGAPWFGDCGWAFSASGAEAQNVVMAPGEPPVGSSEYFKTARWKISFTADAALSLHASVAAIERNKLVAIPRGNPIWWPTSVGVWAGTAGNTNAQQAAVPGVNAQDAPVHVFYSGEDEQVTRWSYSSASVPEVSTLPGSAFVADTTSQQIQTCAIGGTFSVFGFSDGHPGLRVNAHTNTAFGFSNPSFDHVGEGYSRGELTNTYNVGAPVIVESPYSNSYTLDPSCYYINPGPPPVLVTVCGYSASVTYTKAPVTQIQNSYQSTATHRSGLVLFAEDREAVLGVTTRIVVDTGTSSDEGTTTYNQTVDSHKTDGGPCPYLGSSYRSLSSTQDY